MSLIKEYFTQEETEAKNYVCNLCQKTFVAPATGTTSHLWTHLYRKHRKAYDRLKQEDADKKARRENVPRLLVHTVRLHGAPCSSLDGVTACVVYTADSIRKFDSKSNRTADSIRDSIRTQKNDSQLPTVIIAYFIVLVLSNLPFYQWWWSV